MQKPKVVEAMEKYVAADSDADRLLWGLGAMGFLLREAQDLHYPGFPDPKSWTPNQEEVIWTEAEKRYRHLERSVRRGKYNEEVGDAVCGVSEADEDREEGAEGHAGNDLGSAGL